MPITELVKGMPITDIGILVTALRCSQTVQNLHKCLEQAYGDYVY